MDKIMRLLTYTYTHADFDVRRFYLKFWVAPNLTHHPPSTPPLFRIGSACVCVRPLVLVLTPMFAHCGVLVLLYRFDAFTSAWGFRACTRALVGAWSAQLLWVFLLEAFAPGERSCLRLESAFWFSLLLRLLLPGVRFLYNARCLMLISIPFPLGCGVLAGFPLDKARFCLMGQRSQYNIYIYICIYIYIYIYIYTAILIGVILLSTSPCSTASSISAWSLCDSKLPSGCSDRSREHVPRSVLPAVLEGPPHEASSPCLHGWPYVNQPYK